MDNLIFLYLVIFPFGKLLGIIPDVMVVLMSCFFLIKTRNHSWKEKPWFVMVCLFSLLFSLTFFKVNELVTGGFYLVRLISYFYFSRIIYEKYGKPEVKRKLIFDSLIIIGVCIAVFGWVQYFVFPDLRALKTLGWDDHYFRLVSTFLDPAFTGLILVLTEVLVIAKKKYFLAIFLLITILFTYSRASYLALVVASVFLFFKLKQKFLVFLLVLFAALIFILPKPGGEGVNLSRTYSIVDRFINYQDSLTLISKSPVFGVGFNNICVAKHKYLAEINNTSHACSGLDNSLLFIGATTGVVGLSVFVQMIWGIIKNTKFDVEGYILTASLIAIFVHGMFTNTFFYNFILGWMAIVVGITRKKSL